MGTLPHKHANTQSHYNIGIGTLSHSHTITYAHFHIGIGTLPHKHATTQSHYHSYYNDSRTSQDVEHRLPYYYTQTMYRGLNQIFIAQALFFHLPAAERYKLVTEFFRQSNSVINVINNKKSVIDFRRNLSYLHFSVTRSV